MSTSGPDEMILPLEKVPQARRRDNHHLDYAASLQSTTSRSLVRPYIHLFFPGPIPTRVQLIEHRCGSS